MLVLITGLHVLRGPQPSLIKTLIRGEEVSGKAITRWVSSDNNKDFTLRRGCEPARAERAGPPASKHSEQKEAVNDAGNYLSNYGSFVITFRNVSRTLRRPSAAKMWALTLRGVKCGAHPQRGAAE